MADTYPAIADHGLIGDLQTCALVTTGGAIDWFCAPRFDSPSVFGSLLDQQKGGQFSITPVDTDFTTKQLYFPDTGVLITRFMAECGVAEIHDFMPIDNPAQPSERHRIVRMVKVPRGEVRLQMEVAPRFDYGRADPHARVDRARRGVHEREDDAHAALDGAARSARERRRRRVHAAVR